MPMVERLFRSSVIVISTLGFLPGAMSVTAPMVTFRPGRMKSTWLGVR
jgi:hypothetical protein